MRIACVMMQRNEDICLEPWVRYHGYLFGFENIFIIDHGSDSRKTVSLLSQFEDAGMSITRLPADADYKDKGRYIAEEINRVDALESFDFVFPIDCDEFLFLKREDGTPSCSRTEIHKYLEEFQGFPGVLEIKENFLHILGHAGSFWPQPYQKVFFAGGNCALLDHGSHSGVSKASSKQQVTRLAYAHFHFKPYAIDQEMARMKLAPWVDINDLDALRNFQGPGRHLIGHLLKTEEEYNSGFRVDKNSVYFDDIVSTFVKIGVNGNSLFFSKAEPSVEDISPTKKRKVAVLIRTHFYNEALRNLALRITQEAEVEVLFAVDERSQEVSLPDGFKKISLNNRIIEEMAILNVPDSGWRCGDYFLYAARRLHPEYDFFWMIEPDVYLNFQNLSEFFGLFELESIVDIIAAEISVPEENWFWRFGMNQLGYTDVMRCFYPLIRISSRAIDYLYECRKSMTEKFKLKSDVLSAHHWPNDESVTITFLKEGGFIFKDINDFGVKLYDSKNFRFGWPFSASEVKKYPIDNLLYHPVVAGADFVEKIIVRLHHDVRSNHSFNHIAYHYQKRDLFQSVLNETGDNGIAKLKINLELALQATIEKHAPLDRQEIIQRIWRGRDPLKNLDLESKDFDSQGWNSGHPYLVDSIDEIAPKTIVEIGVWKGGSVLAMAQRLKDKNYKSTVIAVDTWLGSWDHWESDEWFGHLNFQQGYPTIAHKFMNNVVLSGLSDFIVPLPVDSVNAAHVLAHYKVFPEIIHLDGGHDYHAVMSDLERWWPLLRNGGIFIGDDYRTDGSWPEVKQAFDDFVIKQSLF